MKKGTPKETLGVKIRRLADASRRSKKEDALLFATGSETWHPQLPFVASDSERDGVQAMFDSGIERLRKAADLGQLEPVVRLATQRRGGNSAVRQRVPWPMAQSVRLG